MWASCSCFEQNQDHLGRILNRTRCFRRKRTRIKRSEINPLYSKKRRVTEDNQEGIPNDRRGGAVA